MKVPEAKGHCYVEILAHMNSLSLASTLSSASVQSWTTRREEDPNTWMFLMANLGTEAYGPGGTLLCECQMACDSQRMAIALAKSRMWLQHAFTVHSSQCLFPSNTHLGHLDSQAGPFHRWAQIFSLVKIVGGSRKDRVPHTTGRSLNLEGLPHGRNDTYMPMT